MTLRIETYEGVSQSPVLVHEFHGANHQEILAIVDAHRGTDSFFRAATEYRSSTNLTTGIFRGISLASVWKWSR